MSRIGITMGCPASIGPELIIKYFLDDAARAECTPVVLGDCGVLEQCAQLLGIAGLTFTPWTPGDPLPADEPKSVPVVQLSQLPKEEVHWGEPNLATAKAMAEYILTGVRLVQEGNLDGITTCPISKHSLNEAGYNYPGHTEMLAELTSSSQYAMMMAGESLKVTLVTIHCPLAEVPDMLTADSVANMIDITHRALSVDLGISEPKIAVAALNPHGGEKELFGSEEERLIRPAIERVAKRGTIVSGPYPPDTIFFKAAKGEFDAVVCMYHDQGLIPFKLLHFDDGVNVTLGLPIVRTSVDHGTAYDIAGKGVADPRSLIEAVKLADRISRNRKAFSSKV